MRKYSTEWHSTYKILLTSNQILWMRHFGEFLLLNHLFEWRRVTQWCCYNSPTFGVVILYIYILKINSWNISSPCSLISKMMQKVERVQQKNTRLIETAAMSITIPVLEEVEPELDIHSHLEFQNRDWNFRKFANCLLPNGINSMFIWSPTISLSQAVIPKTSNLSPPVLGTNKVQPHVPTAFVPSPTWHQPNYTTRGSVKQPQEWRRILLSGVVFFTLPIPCNVWFSPHVYLS